VCLAASRFTDEHDRLAVIDPGAVGERGDRCLRHLGVVSELEFLQPLDDREPRVDQASLLAAFGAFGHLGFEQRGEVGDRGLLLAGCFGGHLPEPALDGREFELGRVRLDQRLQGLGLR
jgi:hypothetical protein